MKWFLPLTLTSCLTLDSFAFNPVHCTTVGPDTCTGNTWDRVCLTCEEPYDWEKDFPWFDSMLTSTESVRPIPNGSVVPITVETEDGEARLDAYWIPSHGGDPTVGQTTMLYQHGNYAGVEHYVPRIQVLHELGYNILIWDYRGFGKSEPAIVPTPDQFFADARLLRTTVREFAPDSSKVVVYGYSLGALPSLEAAIDQPPCALVLEAPFTSTKAIARSNATTALPESFLSSGAFDNISRAADYPGPLLAMVGSQDVKFPAEDVQRLVDNAPGDKEIWILEGVSHGVSDGGIVEAGMTPYAERMRRFFTQRAPACLTP